MPQTVEDRGIARRLGMQPVSRRVYCDHLHPKEPGRTLVVIT